MKTCPKCKIKHDHSTRYCALCHSEFCKADYKKNKLKVLARNKRRKDESRKFIKEYLQSHSCVDCSEDDWMVLEFDHLGDKTHNISKMVVGGYSIKGILSEVEKCEVVCANCHRRRTYKKCSSYRLV